MLLATKFRTVSCVAALLAFGSVGAVTAKAGEATYLAADASHCEIFRVLSRDVPGECGQAAPLTRGLKTRGIKVHAAQQASAAAVAMVEPNASMLDDDEYEEEVETASGSEELSLAMRIQFQLNSSILTEEAKASLDNVASVLNSELMAETVVMLEGHADATGAEDYNLSLSERRAQAVQAYLIGEHEIEDWRLPFVGKGEAELYDRTNPTSSVNRRVEFTNITG
ncbi:MAG: OmpA family protein [Geminicoccaceae bacterium]